MAPELLLRSGKRTTEPALSRSWRLLQASTKLKCVKGPCEIADLKRKLTGTSRPHGKGDGHQRLQDGVSEDERWSLIVLPPRCCCCASLPTRAPEAKLHLPHSVSCSLSLLKTALDHPGGAGSTAVAAALIDAACLVNAEGAADIAFAVGSSWAWEDETVAAP